MAGTSLIGTRRTSPTRRQAAGSEATLHGRCRNDTELLDPVIPPGWSSFVGRTDWVDYYDWSAVRGSSTPTAPGVGVELIEALFHLREHGGLELHGRRRGEGGEARDDAHELLDGQARVDHDAKARLGAAAQLRAELAELVVGGE